MKRILLTLIVCAAAITGAQARYDVDYSSKVDDPADPECNTITASSGWGWYNIFTSSWDVMDYEYLYIKYEATCNFNLVVQNTNWQNLYSVTCSADATEAYIKLVPHAVDYYTCVVIQNHSAGVIAIDKFYFCTADEFFNPAPDDLDEARENLISIRARYEAMLPAFTPGTGYANYSPEAYQALQTALTAAAEAQDGEGGDALTADQLNTLAQAIVDAYRTLIETKVPYYPESGYYRFVVARQFNEYPEAEEGEEIDSTAVTHPLKAMYSDNTGTNGWKTLEPESPNFLWTLERQADNTYVLANLANRLTFTQAEKCTDGTRTIAFDPLVQHPEGYELAWPVSTDDDVVLFNFRFTGEDADAYRYVHANWHDNGNGWGGPMTSWCNTASESGASEWYLVPVDKEEALSILAANSFGRDFVLMLADAKEKAVIANDMSKQKVIEDASQFSSPFSQNDLGSRDGGDLSAGVLIDGDPSTFWHSYWSGGNATNGDHYLQIALSRDVEGDMELLISRRQNITTDHVTTWGIYGSDKPDGEKFDYEWIADVNTPYADGDATASAAFNILPRNGYRYLRFYAEATTSNRGYFHVSEFQLYMTAPNPNNQANRMGDIYTNLVDAIAAADLVDLGNVSRADYENLKAAYDPFIALYVDPRPLRAAIETAQTQLALCEEGEDPGQWSTGSTIEFEEKIEEAIEYDANGEYTQEETDAWVAYLGNARAVLGALANNVTPDSYYAIHFGSEQKYADEGWSTSNAVGGSYGNLFDNYLAPADAETMTGLAATDVRPGSCLFFTGDEEADIEFRFIPVEDGKYIIRHRATGLYVQAYGYDSWAGLSLHPSLFTVEPIGRGEMLIRATDFEGGSLSNLHAQLSDHRLVTWHDAAVGSNSALFIEEMDPVTLGEAVQSYLDFKAGEVTTMCYPVSVTPAKGSTYTVVGTYAQNDKFYVALNKVDGAKGGEPVVYMAEGTYDAEAVGDTTAVAVQLGDEVAFAPVNGTALKGTYATIDLADEAILFGGAGCAVTTDENKTVYANRAYVDSTVPADPAGSYSLVLEVNGELTRIESILATVSDKGDLYGADGRLLKTGATLGDLDQMPAGIYILNGVKILVKDGVAK
jgi:hypothetical protein